MTSRGSVTIPATTFAYPKSTSYCPHAGSCGVATGCHDGRVPRHGADRPEERGGRWYARAWRTLGPGGICHEAAAGDEPELDRMPLWVERERVAEGGADVLFDVVFDELAAAGVTGAKAVLGRGERTLAVLGLSKTEVLALDDRLRARLPAGVVVRVRRAV